MILFVKENLHMHKEPCHQEKCTNKTTFTFQFQVHHMLQPTESTLQAVMEEIWGQHEIKGLYSELTTGWPSVWVDIERPRQFSTQSFSSMFQQDVWG